MSNFEYWHDRATKEAQDVKAKCMTMLQVKVLCDWKVTESDDGFVVGIQTFSYSACQLPLVEGKAKTLEHAWRIALARQAKAHRVLKRFLYPELTKC